MKTHLKMAAAARACAVLLALQLCALGAVRAADNAAAADTPTDSTNPRKEPLEEVVVTGMRANLEKALDAKRTAPVVLDSMTPPSSAGFRMPTSPTPSSTCPASPSSAPRGVRDRRSPCAASLMSTTS